MKHAMTMTEEEWRAVEQRAPTVLPLKGATNISWDKELLVAASQGDIPRMARALDNGADPKTRTTQGNSVAHNYAYGMYTNERDLRFHFASAGLDQETIWRWLKLRGITLQDASPHPKHTSVWEALYYDYVKFTHPIDAVCVEVNLWALWKNLSHQERNTVLLSLDACFARRERHVDVPTSLLEVFPPFISRVMQDVMTFKGIDRSACGKVLTPRDLQDRVLALSSLFSSSYGLPLLAREPFVADDMFLGIWAYAPASVLQDLASLPDYHATLTRSITPLISAFHSACVVPSDASSRPLPVHYVVRRLERAVRTLLQAECEFPPEVLQALLTIEEVRPLLEHALLKKTVEVPKSPDVSPHAAPRSRTRL